MGGKTSKDWRGHWSVEAWEKESISACCRRLGIQTGSFEADQRAAAGTEPWALCQPTVCMQGLSLCLCIACQGDHKSWNAGEPALGGRWWQQARQRGGYARRPHPSVCGTRWHAR